MGALKRSILALIFLGVFLAPDTVKTFHRHAHESEYTHMSGKCIQVYHEPCPVCSFHFSFFTPDHKLFSFSSVILCKEPALSFSSAYIQHPYYLSFFLRSPPLSLINCI